MTRYSMFLACGVVAFGIAWARPQPPRETIDAPTRPIQSGDVITIPVGETVLLAPIIVTHGRSVTIKGAGSGQSTLVYAGEAGGCAIDFVSCYGCTVKDLDIRCDSTGSTGIRFRTVKDTSGKIHPTRNVLDNVRFLDGSAKWSRCVDVDSLIPPGRDNNQDFYRLTRVAFAGYTDSGLRINGSQVKAWTLDQCEFYGHNGHAKTGLDLVVAGNGVLTNCYFGGHTFASIHGGGLWAGDSLVLIGCTTEATEGESLLLVGSGGYPFPMTIMGHCYRGAKLSDRPIIEYGKAGHLTVTGSVFWINSGYTGQPLFVCREEPGTGAGSVSVRGCEFATLHPQLIPRKSILSAPKSWTVDWFGVTVRSLNPPGPWRPDLANPHRSHNVPVIDGRAP